MRQINRVQGAHKMGVILLTLILSSPAFADEAAPAESGIGTQAQSPTEAQLSESLDVSGESELDGDLGDEAADMPDRDWSVSGSFRTSTSMGTLFRSANESRRGAAANFGVTGSYRILPELSASLSLGFMKFLSAYGGSQERFESRFQDISVSAAHSSLYKEEYSGINLSANVSGIIPVSSTSRFTGLRTNVGAGLTLSRGFGPVSLSWSNSFSKNWHKYTSIVVDTDRYPIDALARGDSLEQISATQIALTTGLLTSHSWSTSLNLGWRTPLEGLSFSAGLGFNNSWTYNNGTIGERDQYTSEFARVGRGWRQSMSGSLGANYSFLKHFGASLTYMTAQSPKTSNNRRFRFPFGDTQSGNLQYSSIALGLSATY